MVPISGIQTDQESLQLLQGAIPRLLYCGLTPAPPRPGADAYISLGRLSGATGSLCLKCTTTSLCTNTLIRTKTKTNTKHKNKKHTLTLIKMIMPESFQQNPSNEFHLNISDICLKSCPSTSVFPKMTMMKLWPIRTNKDQESHLPKSPLLRSSWSWAIQSDWKILPASKALLRTHWSGNSQKISLLKSLISRRVSHRPSCNAIICYNTNFNVWERAKCTHWNVLSQSG